MSWLSSVALSRIESLERQLVEERAKRDADLAEHRKFERWCLNMLLRRAQTYPMPEDTPTAKPANGHKPPPPSISPVAISKARVLKAEGEREGRNKAEINQAVLQVTGHTMDDIEAEIERQIKHG